MITTLDNGRYTDWNFGLGAGYGGSTSTAAYADWDSTTSDFGTTTDSALILLYGR